ncbi:MAG TPA: YciI family protein [Candidatus Limnocylindrales bacterium]|nr:YciI family protein [Candidatus Limnocylindrales bacterium]
MRVMVLVKGDERYEGGAVPSTALLAEMGRFNESLVNAGVLLAADGLLPSSRGVRVRFDDRQRTVIDGPFAESKELVAGYWIWQVRSLEEAIEWLKRAPFGGGVEVEIRPIAEADDYGAEFTPELRAQEARMAEQVAARQGAR